VVLELPSGGGSFGTFARCSAESRVARLGDRRLIKDCSTYDRLIGGGSFGTFARFSVESLAAGLGDRRLIKDCSKYD